MTAQCKTPSCTAHNELTIDNIFYYQSAMQDVLSYQGKGAIRLVSAPFDEDTPLDLAAPLSPSSDTSDTSFTLSSFPTSCFSTIDDKYHVDATVIGTGHNGSVRACFDRITGHQCAVKSIRKRDPSVKTHALCREIEILQEMRSQENIIELIDVFEDSEYLHIVTELCQGGELFEKIVEKSASSFPGSHRCFDETEASKIIFQVLGAISSLHKAGIVHRDLKPENILFASDVDSTSVKVIDFGLARRHSPHDAPMNSLVGTPYYIAPEVLRKRYDKACDLWSLGVISYTMLCGYPPFNGESNKEIYDRVRSGQYRFPSVDWKFTSKDARDFIRRLIRLDPSKRLTAEQALNHPWIVKHNRNSSFVVESRDESVEVVFSPSSSRELV
mmetsp:Transcript_36905/g.84254  ORF Transcript_36905/g.84254 Transcript_36905/m.84254 type:complete len:386 (-) Transcript_36905:102-1259(-)